MHIRRRLAKLCLLSGYKPLPWLLACLVISVCLPHRAIAQTPGITPVIELAGLKTRLARHESDLLLVDVRDSTSYHQGHLPGAVNLPVEQSFNQTGDRSHIASLEQMRQVLSKLGIHHSDYLVLYDDGMLKDAAHVFWVLETYGQKKISVLDGGLAGWIADHGAITRQLTTRTPSEYVPYITTHHLSTELATLLGIKNENVEIIDARSHKEYLGLRSRAARKGHIPNAINIPWSANLSRQGEYPQLKSRQVLQSLYNMLKPNEQVITYCNRGKESAVTYLVLRNLGYPVSVYDGAWLEWGNDDHLPISTRAMAGTGVRHGH